MGGISAHNPKTPKNFVPYTPYENALVALLKDQKKSFRCVLCNKRFDTDVALIGHLDFFHNFRCPDSCANREWLCHECGLSLECAKKEVNQLS